VTPWKAGFYQPEHKGFYPYSEDSEGYLPWITEVVIGMTPYEPSGRPRCELPLVYMRPSKAGFFGVLYDPRDDTMYFSHYVEREDGKWEQKWRVIQLEKYRKIAEEKSSLEAGRAAQRDFDNFPVISGEELDKVFEGACGED